MTKDKIILEFHCGDCEVPSLRTEKKLFDLSNDTDAAALWNWLHCHCANGGYYITRRIHTNQDIIDKMVRDGWVAKEIPGEYGRVKLIKDGIEIDSKELRGAK